MELSEWTEQVIGALYVVSCLVCHWLVSVLSACLSLCCAVPEAQCVVLSIVCPRHTFHIWSAGAMEQVCKVDVDAASCMDLCIWRSARENMHMHMVMGDCVGVCVCVGTCKVHYCVCLKWAKCVKSKSRLKFECRRLTTIKYFLCIHL